MPSAYRLARRDAHCVGGIAQMSGTGIDVHHYERISRDWAE